MGPIKRRRWLLLLLLVPLILIAFTGWREAARDPVVRRATVALPGWPAGEPPVDVLLISDIHVAGGVMSPERLEHIVETLNALDADAVLIAGDLVSESLLYPGITNRAALAPLGGFDAPLGTYAVLGNHEHRRGVAGIRRALDRAGVRLLEDQAVRIGPVTLGGIDDSVTDHSDFEGTLRRMAALGAPYVLLSHGTSHFDWLPPAVTLMLTGHTHCGQFGFLVGKHRPCGVTRAGGRTMITTAGLGTSGLPIRLGAPPDVWLIRLGPES